MSGPVGTGRACGGCSPPPSLAQFQAGACQGKPPTLIHTDRPGPWPLPLPGHCCDLALTAPQAQKVSPFIPKGSGAAHSMVACAPHKLRGPMTLPFLQIEGLGVGLVTRGSW